MFFDEPVSEDRLSQLRNVYVWTPFDDRLQRLPETIRRMPNLVRLSLCNYVDGSAVEGIREGDIPESLEELNISYEGRVIRWPDVVLPRLRSLFVHTVFRFDTSAFPVLRELSVSPDRKQSNVRAALNLPLEELNVLRVSLDQEIFDIVSAQPLRRLGLLGGRALTSLDGISALPQLEELRLKNLPGLSRISGLRELPSLSRLSIQYCTRITDIEVLNDLPKLNDLQVIGCGGLGLGPVKDTISRIPKADTSATT